MVSQIFDEEPWQWGYRGDPFVWKELKSKFQDVDESDLTTNEFMIMLEKHFSEIIELKGEKESDEKVVFEDFPQGGMSGGWISLVWWKEKGFPLLRKQFIELKEIT